MHDITHLSIAAPDTGLFLPNQEPRFLLLSVVWEFKGEIFVDITWLSFLSFFVFCRPFLSSFRCEAAGALGGFLAGYFLGFSREEEELVSFACLGKKRGVSRASSGRKDREGGKNRKVRLQILVKKGLGSFWPFTAKILSRGTVCLRSSICP